MTSVSISVMNDWLKQRDETIIRQADEIAILVKAQDVLLGKIAELSKDKNIFIHDGEQISFYWLTRAWNVLDTISINLPEGLWEYYWTEMGDIMDKNNEEDDND